MKHTTTISNVRFYLVVFAFALALAGVITRVVYLHVFNNDFLRHQGELRTVRVVDVPAYRGMITDVNGEPLAVSAPVDSVWINPKIFNASTEKMSQLAQYLQVSSRYIEKRLQQHKEKSFVYLKRHISPKSSGLIAALDIEGVFLEKEYRRFYPTTEVAAHVVGFTNIDDEGQEGLELAFDEQLRGIPGKKRVLKDRLGRVVQNLESIQQPRPGQNVRLSIDKRIQYIAYRSLKAAVQKHQADSGSAVMIDVTTGEILAMVNQPSFNPNDRRQRKSHLYRNRAVTDVFEPGSTAKPLAIVATLNSGRYSSSSLVDTHPGRLQIANSTIRDARNYGVIDVSTVIQKSSNVGMSKLALSISPKSIWNVYNQFGVGQLSYVGLPGERSGVLPHYSEWYPVEQATVSYGYGFSVTALQLAHAYATLGAYGVKKPLSITKLENEPKGERIVSRHVAKEVLDMLYRVVEPGGTGQKAQVRDYQVGGKTGTVRKVGESGYTDNEYLAVFAGVAPVSNPKLALVILVNNPKGEAYYGGQVAAPVFSEVMTDALRLLNIAPDKDAIRPILPLHVANHLGVKS